MGHHFRVPLLAVVLVTAAAVRAPAQQAAGAPAIPSLPQRPESGCPDDNPLAIRACGREHAKTFKPPRTADGKPDFSGYWGGSQVAHENLEAHPRAPDDN